MASIIVMRYGKFGIKSVRSQGCSSCTYLIYLCLQTVELDVIHGQAVEASENIKEGNEQVRGVSLAIDIYQ